MELGKERERERREGGERGGRGRERGRVLTWQAWG